MFENSNQNIEKNFDRFDLIIGQDYINILGVIWIIGGIDLGMFQIFKHFHIRRRFVSAKSFNN